MERNKILEALSTIRDPNTGRDLVNAGMVEDLKIEDKQINLTIALPSLNHPSKTEIIFNSQGILEKMFPGVSVNVHVTAKAPTATPPPSKQTNNIKNIIAVASGKGGVGKSTISVNLALALKKAGAKVGLIDADLYGPSIPTMVGLQGKRPKIQDVDGQPKIVPLEAYGLPLISMGFIVEPEQAVVLRGPRLAGIIKQFFNEVIWPDLDYLVVDLPPGTGDIQLTLVQTVPVTGALIVTTPQEVAVADAIKAVNMFRLQNVEVPILGVIENMSWFTPAELPNNKYYIFGMGGGDHLAKQSESTLLGQVPLVQSIRESGDMGKPIVLDETNPAAQAFMELAENTLKQIEKRNKNQAPTKTVQVEG